MAQVKILFEGTREELAPILAKFKTICIERMEQAETLDRARQLWNDFKRFQKDPDFIKAKDDAKKRLSQDLFTK